jgi:hypothetical protein
MIIKRPLYMYKMIRKLTHMLLLVLLGRYDDTQEDLGISCILIAFTEDAVAIARTAIDDAPASGQAHYRLHSALRAPTGVPTVTVTYPHVQPRSGV